MTGPRLLLDENLSPRLVSQLAEMFPGTVHVDDVGLHGRSDEEVWGHARQHEFVLVSKDNDFRQLSFLRGAPPKVVWLHIGNAPTSVVLDLLGQRSADIASFVDDKDASLLTIETGREYP